MPRVAKATPKKAAPKKAAVTKTAVKKAAVPVKKASAPKKAAVPPKKVARVKPAPPVKKVSAPAAKAAPAVKTAAPRTAAKPKKVVFDKFMIEQRELLLEERANHVAQAQELRAEADLIAAEMEPGDVQFDEESGEGTTIAIDRERDLALSMQAQIEVEEIDHALDRLQAGTYGACERCRQAIPKPRLRAIPQARLCIACKSGGLSRR